MALLKCRGELKFPFPKQKPNKLKVEVEVEVEVSLKISFAKSTPKIIYDETFSNSHQKNLQGLAVSEEQHDEFVKNDAFHHHTAIE